MVVYDHLIEPGRLWNIERCAHRHTEWHAGGWREVRECARRAGSLIVTHLTPRALAASLWVSAAGGRVVYFSDGGVLSERDMDIGRRVIRLGWFRFCRHFVAGTPDARRLFVETYGVNPNLITSSYLCPLEVFRPSAQEKVFDVIVGGRDIFEKNNAFSIAVCAALGSTRPLRIGVFGDVGRSTSLAPLTRLPNVSVLEFGPVSPDRLADLFRASRVFLIPSLREPWGLTLHEALRCACAVVSSPNVTSAAYLAKYYPQLNVLPLEVSTWADRLARLLREEQEAPEMPLDPYDLDAAAKGLVAAVET